MPKLLLITYYWPPAGGPGVQRWLQMIPFLSDDGFEITVFVPDNAAYPIVDPQLENQVPTGVEILRHRIWEPGQFLNKLFPSKSRRMSAGILKDKDPGWLEKVLLGIRGNIFIPDARVGWIKSSVKRLVPRIEKQAIETVITTGPPHSVHLIGLNLKEKTGVKWVADFRDPWTSIGYHHKLRLGERAQQKHKMLEKKVLTNADKILVTSPGTEEEFKKLTDRPIHLITNGYKDWAVSASPLSSRFTIAHIGSLLSARNPVLLWEALAELMEEETEFAQSLELILAGKVSEEVLESIHTYGLGSHLHYMGYRPYNEIRELQASAQVLLLLEINSQNTKSILPGKLFEYLSSRRPILAIGPKEWDAKEILEKTGTGKAFEYEQKIQIKKQLFDWFSRFKSRELTVNSQGVEAYSRKNISKALAEVLRWE